METRNLVIAAAALLAASSTAMAAGNIGLSIGFSVAAPAYYAPAPTY